MRYAVWSAALLTSLPAWAGGPADPPVTSVVVLANRRLADSCRLAEAYAQARHIPASRVIPLDLPATEAISRGTYERELAEPLRQTLRARRLVEPAEGGSGSNAIKYLVCMRGVPLRIRSTWSELAEKFRDARAAGLQRSEAAVESELALLLHAPYELRGPYPNPLFGEAANSRWLPDGQGLLLATRLDAPDEGTVRRMIAGSLQAEYYGLHGRAYFDATASTLDDYQNGNLWILRASDRWRQEGYECGVDFADACWGTAFPMEHAAVYMGWYHRRITGPFLRADFSFMPGAIAYHLHSLSARTLRDSQDYWVGPLLGRGAACSLGAVGEPFLGQTPRLDRLTDALLAGRTFGESAYAALPSLSWQIAVVGDPLYTPFRYSLDEQIRHMEKDHRPELPWAYLRQVNRLLLQGSLSNALALGQARWEQTRSPVLLEKLGALYGLAGQPAEAEAALAEVVHGAATAATAVRAGARQMALLRDRHDEASAAAVETAIRRRWPNHPALAWLRAPGPLPRTSR